MHRAHCRISVIFHVIINVFLYHWKILTNTNGNCCIYRSTKFPIILDGFHKIFLLDQASFEIYAALTGNLLFNKLYNRPDPWSHNRFHPIRQQTAPLISSPSMPKHSWNREKVGSHNNFIRGRKEAGNKKFHRLCSNPNLWESASRGIDPLLILPHISCEQISKFDGSGAVSGESVIKPKMSTKWNLRHLPHWVEIVVEREDAKSIGIFVPDQT